MMTKAFIGKCRNPPVRGIEDYMHRAEELYKTKPIREHLAYIKLVFAGVYMAKLGDELM